MKLSIEYLGNAIYMITLLLAALCLARGHRENKINVWEIVTSTDRNGIVRTDGRKLFECGAFFVMTVTFYFLTVTGHMTEWYALIYASAWVAARGLRDMAQIKQQQTAKPRVDNPEG